MHGDGSHDPQSGDSPRRPVSSPSHPNWRRDWSNLGRGPAGLIAERLLANDVADYIRFRAVCCPWRRCSTDPRAHGILDRRFHPRKWIMLREAAAAPDHRRLLNVSTGECIRMRLPELSGHRVFVPTTEGLLVLLDRSSYVVRLLNPLTGQVTDLPAATTLLRVSRYRKAFEVSEFGLADDSTFVVYFSGVHMLAMAKPGDECWTLVDKRRLVSSAISFEGRFYCATDRGLMVVETSANQPPHLALAAKLTKVFSCMSSTVHLVDNGGELILVRRNVRQGRFEVKGRNYIITRRERFAEYKTYRVDLEAMDLKPILGLGGRAIFIGLRSALSVSTSVFPSIKSDSIYVGSDDDLMLRNTSKSNGVYCLTDGTTESRAIFKHGGFNKECGSMIGLWGIDDYLSWYVTDTHQVGSLIEDH